MLCSSVPLATLCPTNFRSYHLSLCFSFLSDGNPKWCFQTSAIWARRPIRPFVVATSDLLTRHLQISPSYRSHHHQEGSAMENPKRCLQMFRRLCPNLPLSSLSLFGTFSLNLHCHLSNLAKHNLGEERRGNAARGWFMKPFAVLHLLLGTILKFISKPRLHLEIWFMLEIC